VLRFGTTTVHNGPGMQLLNPFSYRSASIEKAEMLSTLDFACVLDTLTGVERVEQGPKLLFLGPHEKVVSTDKATCLGKGEFLHVENKISGEKKTIMGPCVFFPGPHEKRNWGTSLTLSMTEYAIVVNKLSGERHIVKGPCVWYPEPHEAATKGHKITLTTTEYLISQNKLTGEKQVVKGPCVWTPEPHEECLQKSSNGFSLNEAEYITVEETLSGKLTMVKGPCTWFPGPYDKASEKQTAIALQDDEYVFLKDASSGQRWVEKGPSLLFLEPMWRAEGADSKKSGVRKAFVLKSNEYIRLVDGNTGKVTVHRGESKVFPGPDDVPLDSGVQQAVQVDGEHAVLVRDRCSGQLRLVTEKQAFVPGPHDNIEEIRELIKLAEHEAMILKDIDGKYQYYYGSAEKRAPDQPSAFFLPPHTEIVKMWWSRGPRRERKDVSFERFDCRPHFMKLEFNCRTSDNVELVLDGVIFWELVDLPAMWHHTSDTSGDMVYHIRSKFIQEVAQVTLKVFMETLHTISKGILEGDTEFYTERGIKVHSLEVTRYQCADKSTAAILEQIIQETTNRMNRLSQAESENEVGLFKTQGQVEQSRLNGDLLAIQHEQMQDEAQVTGTSESQRVASFLKGLEKDVPLLEDRIRMWQVLRKTEALSVVSNGGASLYYTPNDVDLSIEARQSTKTGSKSES